jgi:two-component sensor histidine kinase
VVLEVCAESMSFEEHDWWEDRQSGLQTIRKYAEQLDAHLSFGSAPGHGTTLSVRVPLAGGSAPSTG